MPLEIVPLHRRVVSAVMPVAAGVKGPLRHRLVQPPVARRPQRLDRLRVLRVALIGRVQQMRGWVDAREAELLAVVHDERDDVDTGARDITQLCQQQANVGYGEAKRRSLRATWLVELPQVGAALTRAGAMAVVESDGWFCKIKVAEPAEIDALMDADAYSALVENES